MSNKVIFFDAVNIFVVSKSKTTNAKISDGSTNVVQTYTFSLEQYMYVKSNAKVSMKEFFKLDKANCLDCPFSGNSGNGKCYTHAPVQYWGFLSMIRSINDSDLTILNNDKINKILSMCKDKYIRFGTYGEPSLMPMYLVDSMTKVSKNWTGYTHQYAKEWAKDYKNYFMASIESATEKTEWRAFRVLINNNYESNAVQCPASKEAGKVSNCAKCGLCSGLLGKGTKDVKILQH